MAVYKIFPEKSATIYSQYPYLNSGNDEILELSNQQNSLTSSVGTSEVSRTLIQFLSSSINDTFSLIGNTNYKVYLKLFLATASSLPLNYTIYCYPISGTWDRGTGKADNDPQTTDGVSWKYRTYNALWSTSSFVNSTSSYQNSNTGGGVWYTSSNLISSQSFNNLSVQDIELDVTNIITSFYSSSLGLGGVPNNGLIIKNANSVEFSTGSLLLQRYFSANTHTIYPPQLEFRWNDNIFVTGSSVIVNDDKIVLTLSNNKGVFQENSVQKFNINVRDKFPSRQFTTSSVYLNNKLLPSQSYWAIKDAHTEEIVVNFDNNYTTINSDGTGSYFNVYMNGLEPERNYRFIFKSIINNQTLIFDDNYYFKVIR
jgi:hypothetical protein